MRRFLDITSAPFSSQKSSRESSQSFDLKPEKAPAEALLRFWGVQPGDVHEAADALGWVVYDGRLIASSFDFLDYECGKCFFPLWGLNVMPRDRTAEFKHREEKFSVNVLSYRVLANSDWSGASMPAGYDPPHEESGSDSDSNSTMASTDSIDDVAPRQRPASTVSKPSDSSSSSNSDPVKFFSSTTTAGAAFREEKKQSAHGDSTIRDVRHRLKLRMQRRRKKDRSSTWEPKPLWLSRAKLPDDGCPGCKLMQLLMKFVKGMVIQSGNPVVKLSFPWKEQKLRIYLEGCKRGALLAPSAFPLKPGNYTAGLDVFVDYSRLTSFSSF